MICEAKAKPMSSLSSATTRKYIQALVTSLLLVGLILYYQKAYQPAKSNQLLEHKNRQLIKFHESLANELQQADQWLAATEYSNRDSLNLSQRSSRTAGVNWVSAKFIKQSPHNQYFDIATAALIKSKPREDSSKLIPIWSKPLAQLLPQHLPIYAFEGFVVLHDNKVVYQTFASGLVSLSPDSLGEIQKKGIKAKILRLNLRGINYLAFAEPWIVNPSETLFVLGLQKEELFHEESGKLPQPFVVFLVVFALAATMLLPWLRVYFAGNTEHLVFRHFWQLYLSIWVLGALTAYVSLLVWKDHHYRLSRTDQLMAKATEIGVGLDAELDHYQTLLVQTKALTASFKNNNSIWKAGEIISFKELKAKNQPGYDSVFSAIGVPDALERIFFISKKGEELLTIQRDSSRRTRATFNNRNYFKKALISKAGTNTSMEYVKSWIDGEKRLVLAQPFGQIGVAALSLNMKSLLPESQPFWQFAVIDSLGAVQFHSQRDRELNENLFDETEGNERLQFLIKSKLSGEFEGNYHQKLVHGYVEKLISDFYLVVLSEDEPYTHAMSNSFYFMLLLLLALLAIQALVLLVIKWLGSKPYFANPDKSVLTWLLPHSAHGSIYLISSVYHVLLLAGIFGLYQYRLCASAIALFLLVLLASLLSLLQVQMSYLLLHVEKPAIRWLKIKVLLFLGLASALVLAGLMYLLPESSNITICLLTWVGLILIGILLSYVARFFAKNPIRRLAIPAFSLMMILRVTLVGFAPAALFYLHASRMEYSNIERGRDHQSYSSFEPLFSGLELDYKLWTRLRFHGKSNQALSLADYTGALVEKKSSFENLSQLATPTLLLFLFVLACTWVISRTLNKMLGADLPHFSPDQSSESEQYKLLFGHNLLVLEGLPGTEKLSFFKLKANVQTNGDLVSVDLFGANTPEKVQTAFEKAIIGAASHSRWILIKNFEFGSHLGGTTQSKFEQLSLLLQQRHSHIAIFTCKPLREMASAQKLDEGLIASLLRDFLVVPVGFSQNENIPEALDRECLYGVFLGNLAISSEYWLRHYAQGSGFSKERGLLTEIQWRAAHYYHAIWECLSFEEQMLVYDLATDQLVNSGADASLSRLIKKGLIVRNNAGRLVLFNKSFALHVNTAISEENAEKIKSYVKATGTWEAIKVPLLLSAGAVMVFLAGSNQDLLQQTEQQLAAYAAAGALLVKMLGYFGRPFSIK